MVDLVSSRKAGFYAISFRNSFRNQALQKIKPNFTIPNRSHSKNTFRFLKFIPFLIPVNSSLILINHKIKLNERAIHYLLKPTRVSPPTFADCCLNVKRNKTIEVLFLIHSFGWISMLISFDFRTMTFFLVISFAIISGVIAWEPRGPIAREGETLSNSLGMVEKL